MKRFRTTLCTQFWHLGYKPKLATLYQPLYTLLNQNISLTEALTLLAASSETMIQKQAINKIRQLMQNGIAFSQAITMSTKQPTAYEINLIQLGEQSQQLAPCLSQLHEHHLLIKKLQSQIIQACFYPCFTLVTAIVICIMLLTTVLPTCFDIFQDKSHTLPPLTQKLGALSAYIQNNGITTLTSIIFTVVFLLQMSKKPRLQVFCNQIKIHLPVWHQLAVPIRYSTMTHMLSLGLAQHLSFTQALQLTAKSQTYYPLQQALNQWLHHLQQGHPYHTAASLVPPLPTKLKQWLKLSTDQTHLANNLLQLSQYYLALSEQKSLTLTRWLNPLLLLITSTVVGTIMMGIYMPIFELGDIIA